MQSFKILSTLVIAAGLSVAAAGRSHANMAFATTFQAAPKDGHDHKHGDGHKDEHTGPKTELGSKKIGGFDIKVTQVGEVKAGEEAVFVVTVSGGSGEPKAVRAWVGVESGQGSIKTKAEEEKEGEWHAHHKVSKPTPAGSKLWVEVEGSSGKKRDSFDIKL